MDTAHPFQGDFEPTAQAFVDTFVSSGLSQSVAESTFFGSGNILDLVFTSVIDRIGDVNTHHFPHCGYCPIVFDNIFVFSYELTPKICLSKLGEKENKYKI